jgi:hypothetical protein
MILEPYERVIGSKQENMRTNIEATENITDKYISNFNFIHLAVLQDDTLHKDESATFKL